MAYRSYYAIALGRRFEVYIYSFIICIMLLLQQEFPASYHPESAERRLRPSPFSFLLSFLPLRCMLCCTSCSRHHRAQITAQSCT
jgi:hypothetical protein